jgi:ADP-ribose pyrophosphatase YjhB (NUDIX family)
MRPHELFRFCPKCAAPRAEGNAAPTPFRCVACGLVFDFNPTVAAAGLVFDATGRVILTRRAKEPAAGKFAAPGGFIDFGETAEDGLRREVREETGLEVANVRFLVSFPNLYHYRDVSYPVVDLYFTADAMNPEAAEALDGVTSIEWRRPDDVPDAEIAFESMRVALRAVRLAAR